MSGLFSVEGRQDMRLTPGFDNAECFYQANVTLPSPDILAVPIIFSSHTGGGAGTNEIKDNFIIDQLPQSAEMSAETNIFSDNSFQLLPSTDSGQIVTAFDFFNAVGLHQNDNDSRWKTSYDSSSLSSSISWNLGAPSKSYFVGVDEISKIFDNNINHLRLSTNGSPELPRQIEISLLNLGHTPHAGSFAMDKLYTEPDINKVVSYVNTDPQYFDVDSKTLIFSRPINSGFLLTVQLKNIHIVDKIMSCFISIF